MGCAHGNDLDISTHESFNGTVMIPLIPNPNTSRPKNSYISTITPPCYNFLHRTTLLPLNHHLAAANANGQTRTQFIEQPLGNSRWNPTPEQLLALEEMYRRGTRTPSAEQIQHIATQLRRFGKIEGKNVFYWFQNHKARERQKRRREIEFNSEEKNHETDHNLQKKEPGLRKTNYDVEQTRNWASCSNWSKHSEEFVTMHKSVTKEENGPHGWTKFDESELQQIKGTNNTVENMNATWQAMEFPCPHPTSLIINTNTTTSLATKLLNTSHDHYHQNLSSSFNNVMECETGETTEHQTLELFPLSSDVVDATKKDLKVVHNITTINTYNFTPHQYIEFLPLKN